MPEHVHNFTRRGLPLKSRWSRLGSTVRGILQRFFRTKTARRSDIGRRHRRRTASESFSLRAPRHNVKHGGGDATARRRCARVLVEDSRSFAQGVDRVLRPRRLGPRLFDHCCCATPTRTGRGSMDGSCAPSKEPHRSSASSAASTRTPAGSPHSLWVWVSCRGRWATSS